MRPSIGRVVHFRALGTAGTGPYRTEMRAAVITAIHSETRVSLTVLNPTGICFCTAEYDGSEGAKSGTWCGPTKEVQP